MDTQIQEADQPARKGPSGKLILAWLCGIAAFPFLNIAGSLTFHAVFLGPEVGDSVADQLFVAAIFASVGIALVVTAFTLWRKS